jgi:hypothetical protein
MLNLITIFALSAVLVVCIYCILTSPPIIEYNEDEMREFINKKKRTTTTYYYEPKQAETYYEMYKRISVKENCN